MVWIGVLLCLGIALSQAQPSKEASDASSAKRMRYTFPESWGKVVKVYGSKHDWQNRPDAEMFFFKVEQGYNEYWKTYVAVYQSEPLTSEEATDKCQKLGEGLSVVGWKSGKLASLTKMKDVTYTWPHTYTKREPAWIWEQNEEDGSYEQRRKKKTMAAIKEAISEIMEQSQKKDHATWVATPKDGTGVNGQECVSIGNSEKLSFDTRRCNDWLNSFICELEN